MGAVLLLTPLLRLIVQSLYCQKVLQNDTDILHNYGYR